jgi:hypothetical protein
MTKTKDVPLVARRFLNTETRRDRRGRGRPHAVGDSRLIFDRHPWECPRRFKAWAGRKSLGEFKTLREAKAAARWFLDNPAGPTARFLELVPAAKPLLPALLTDDPVVGKALRDMAEVANITTLFDQARGQLSSLGIWPTSAGRARG